ncbi:GTPase family protein [Hyphomicrobium sp.]|uniref:GTPase family protein n=1 Tax=Hyphomicrobium sp. TaxID=82 RepID=UPI003F703962
MTRAPGGKRRAQRTASLILITIGLLIPALSLIPLGSLWLWQNGYLIYWTIFALSAVSIVYLVQRRLLPARPEAQPAVEADVSPSATSSTAGSLARDLSWSPAEELAWGDVEALAAKTDPARIETTESMLKLGQEAIETVAHRLHPGRTDPIWQFTTPEALAIVERVSRRLRTFVLENVPFGERMTVAQALALYRWRGAIDAAERAYDVWRVVRLINPATAAAQEAREQLSKAMVQWGRDAISRRLMEVYVLEIGRAAIDLYGGRLRVSSGSLAGYVSADSAADREAIGQVKAEPLRILVAGQVSAGKSSLINALAREARAASDALPATSKYTPYVLQGEGFPAAFIIDSPGIGSDAAMLDELVEKAADCDLMLWVVAVNRADRETDRKALEGVRLHFASRLNRRRPPIILVTTHIDRLRPFNEWSPPYDLASGDSEKARNIRSAVAAAAGDLGFEADEAVALSLNDPAKPYNVEQLWQRIADALPEATRAQLLRCLNDLKESWSWKSLWTQAGNAGRTLAGTLKPVARARTQAGRKR